MIDLAPHSTAPAPVAVVAVQAQAERTARGRMTLRYRLAGDLERLRVPELRESRQGEELWRHTCFEVFVAAAGTAAYHELNFSPSTLWAAYAFGGYRARTAFDAARVEPKLSVRRSADEVVLEAELALAGLSPGYENAGLHVGMSAVVEDDSGRLSYWALHHPAPEPDFHDRASFALFLEDSRES